MRRAWAGIAILMACAGAVTTMPATAGQSGRTGDVAAVVAARLAAIDDVAAGGEPLRVRVAVDPADDGVIRDGVLTLSPTTLAALRTPAEMDGVLATILAFSRDGRGLRAVARSPGIGSYLAAAAFAGVADRVDPRDSRGAPEARRNYGSAPPRVDALPGSAQGREALRMMNAVGSCSGAALAALSRLAIDPATATAPIGRLGAQARAGFSTLAMPPDRSCVSD